MDKDILDENNNPSVDIEDINNKNSENKEITENTESTAKDEHKADDIYSDYPKEVVQLLMNSNPLRNREQQQSLKANETKEERFSKTREQRATRLNETIPTEEETEKPKTVKSDNELKQENRSFASEEKEIFVPEIDDDVDDIAQTVKKEEKKNKGIKDDDFSFDDDIELVQVIRHKSPKKEYKRNFPINNKSEKNASEKKQTEKPETPQSNEFKTRSANLFSENNDSEFDDLKKKFTEEKRAKRKQAAISARKQSHSVHSGELESRKKSYKNKADLNDFFAAPRRSSGLNSEKKEKLDKGILAVCGVVVLVIVVLFVRSLMLSAKVEEAEQQLADYTQLQETNEELKLEIVSLQEKLTENGISLLDEPEDGKTETSETSETGASQTENPEGTQTTANDTEYDTYTVIAGDTLSGISDKVYGNYSGYKKILEANGLTENSSLQIGQVLKIPKN